MTGQTRLVDNRSYAMSFGGFDALHRPTTTTYPNGEIVTTTFDREGENKLRSSLDPANAWLVEDIRYNGMGQMTYLNRYNVADTTYNYHTTGSSLYRLQTIQHGSLYTDSKPDFGYTYDPVGNILTLQTKYKEGSTTYTDSQSFGYDHLNRLLTASATGGVADYAHTVANNTDYEYDKLGNVYKFGGSNNAYDYYTWDMNCDPLPTQTLPHAVKTINNTSYYFCYDANGNMTKRVDATGSYTQDFNVENQLISVSKTTGGTTTFAYDAAGMRVKTDTPTGQIIYTPFPGYEEELRTPPTVDLTGNGQPSIQLGANQSFTLAWSSTETQSCTASGQWSGSKATSGSQGMTSPASGGTYTYTLTCTNPGGSTSDSVTVTVVPIVNFTVNGSSTGTTVDPAATFTLAWSTQGATSCTASASPPSLSWFGSKAVSGSQNIVAPPAEGTYNFTLTCVGPNGTAVRTLPVYVIQLCPGSCGGGGDTHLPPNTPAEGLAALPPLAKMNHLARPRLQSGGSTIIRTTYFLAGQTIATRVSGDPVSGNNGLFYIYSDHLGSSSLLVNSSNNPVAGSRTWYLPFGGYRAGSAPTQTITDRDFTGQKENMELGLLYYGARFYVPGLGRFASADTIVPNPANPQSYNRYSYVRNNPLNMTDPTGHRETDCPSETDCSPTFRPPQPPPPPQQSSLPQVTKLWIEPEAVEAIQLYGNTNAAFFGEIGTSNYDYSQGFHGGLDLLATYGTEVVAGIKGKVVWVEDGAYGPNYVVIEIAPDTYILLGHLEGVKVAVDDYVTPNTPVGVVANRTDVDHLHVEFWTGPGDSIRPRMIETPYQYMSPEVETQFLGLMADMDINANRITFHDRSDGMWSSMYDQPDLIYYGSNLNDGQPGYENP
jgi:RHS repeat-associated protein